MKKKIFIGILFLIIILIISSLAFKKRDINEEFPLVNSYEIVNKKIENKVRVKGEVEAKEVKKIYIARAQKVKKVYYKSGDKVNKNDIIIEFDNEMKNNLERDIKGLELDIENEKLKLNTYNNPHGNVSVISAEKNLREIENQCESAKKSLLVSNKELNNIRVIYENFKKNRDSKEKLLMAGGISQSDFEKVNEELRRLKTEVERKELNIEEERIKITLLEKQVEIAKSDLENKKSNKSNDIKLIKNNIKKYQLVLENKKEELKKLVDHIKSPFSSTILSMEAEDNYRVNVEKPLIELADISSQLIKTRIPVYNIDKIKNGQSVKIKLKNIDSIDFEGTITKISAIATLYSSGKINEKVVNAEITPKEKNEILKPGYDVDLEIIIESKKEAHVVPNLSIVYEDGEKFLYIIKDDNTLEKRKIELGIEDILVSEVKGLKLGEKIVSNPQPQLSDGMKVRIKENTDDKA